jgi:hypothetical protein
MNDTITSATAHEELQVWGTESPYSSLLSEAVQTCSKMLYVLSSTFHVVLCSPQAAGETLGVPSFLAWRISLATIETNRALHLRATLGNACLASLFLYKRSQITLSVVELDLADLPAPCGMHVDRLQSEPTTPSCWHSHSLD